MRELGREIATGKEAREIYKIGEQYETVDETLDSVKRRGLIVCVGTASGPIPALIRRSWQRKDRRI